jgi:hypothetical protein
VSRSKRLTRAASARCLLRGMPHQVSKLTILITWRIWMRPYLPRRNLGIVIDRWGSLSCAWRPTDSELRRWPVDPTSGNVKLLLPPRQSRGNSHYCLVAAPRRAPRRETKSLRGRCSMARPSGSPLVAYHAFAPTPNRVTFTIIRAPNDGHNCCPWGGRSHEKRPDAQPVAIFPPGACAQPTARAGKCRWTGGAVQKIPATEAAARLRPDFAKVHYFQWFNRLRRMYGALRRMTSTHGQ